MRLLLFKLRTSKQELLHVRVRGDKLIFANTTAKLALPDIEELVIHAAVDRDVSNHPLVWLYAVFIDEAEKCSLFVEPILNRSV